MNGRLIGMSILFLMFSNMVVAQQVIELKRDLPVMDAASGEYFGNSVDVYQEFAVVGAPLNSRNGYLSGMAYIFKRSGEQWIQVAELVPSDASDNDLFGTSVAIDDNIVAVGTPYRNDHGNLSGAVYIFEKPVSGWGDNTETAKVFCTDINEFYQFGISVSLHGDTLAVGAPGADGNISRCGAVYVFTRPSTGWQEIMAETAKLVQKSPVYHDINKGFGYSIDVSDNLIVAGQPAYSGDFYEEGAIYVFSKSSGPWQSMTEKARLEGSSAGNNNSIGISVSIGNNYILAGAERRGEDGLEPGCAYVYSRPSAGWVNGIETAVLLPDVPDSVLYFTDVQVLAGDSTAFFGVPYTRYPASLSSKGLVYVFNKSPGGWSNMPEAAVLKSSDGDSEINTGFSLAGNDEFVLTGAPADNYYGRSGALYFFQKPVTNWVGTHFQKQVITAFEISATDDHFGSNVAVSGNYAVVGSPGDDERALNAGAAYVFRKSGNLWNEAGKLMAYDGQPEDGFGASVGIYGNTIVVGAPENDGNLNNAGALYVFRIDESGNVSPGMALKIFGKNMKAGDHLGTAVDIHKDFIVAGGIDPGGTDFTGRVFIFRITESEIDQVAELTTSGEVNRAYRFGEMVSIYENQVVVGAGNAWINWDYNQPKTFLYKMPPEGWSDMTETAYLYNAGETGFKGMSLPVEVNEYTAFSGIARANAQPGRVLIFQKPGSEWENTTGAHQLVPLENTGGEEFGAALSLSGNYLVAGNPGDMTDLNMYGKCHVFTSDYEDWVNDNKEIDQVLPSFLNDVSGYGRSAGIFSNDIIIGAPDEDNENGVNAGAAYFYKIDQPAVEAVRVSKDGIYGIGDTISIQVGFDQQIQVSGIPEMILTLNDSMLSMALYNQLKDSSLVLYYIVEEGHISPHLDYRNEDSFLNGGSVFTSGPVPANRVLPPVGTKESLGWQSVVIDGIRPEILIETTAAPYINKPFDFTITFSETVFDLDLRDIRLINGDFNNLSISNDTVSGQVLPIQEGEVILFIDKDDIFDLADNGNDSTGFITVYDITPPVINFHSEQGIYVNESFNLLVTASEEIVGLNAEEIQVLNGEIVSSVYLNDTLSVLIQPQAEGEVTLIMKGSSVYDLAGNGNDSTVYTVIYDIEPPRLFFSSDSGLYINENFSVLITASEKVIGLDENAVMVENGAIVGSTLVNDSLQVMIAPLQDGKVIVFLMDSAVFDLAGNGNDSTGIYRIYDINPPEIIFYSHSGLYVNGNFRVLITASEEITGLSVEDVTASNGEILYSDLSNDSLTLEISPLEEGEVVLTVADSSVFDVMDYGNERVSLTVIYDLTAPAVELSIMDNDDLGSIFGVIAAFSEPVLDFGPDDIIADNINYISIEAMNDSSYLIWVEPSVLTGAMSMAIGEATLTDRAGNPNFESNQLVFQILSIDGEPDEQLLIYPNPSDGRFFITRRGIIMEVNGTIVSNEGRIVERFTLPEDSVLKFIDLHDIPNGVYFLVMEIDGNTFREKIVFIR